MLIITTNNRAIACLTPSDNVVKHCCLTAGHTELHLGMSAPLSDIFYHRAVEAGLW